MPNRILRPRLLLAAALLLLPAAGCVRNPQSEAQAAQQFQEIADALNELRQSTASLNGTVDSLRTVVARQDTTISRMAAVTGVPVAR